jgi:hypothetical protein
MKIRSTTLYLALICKYILDNLIMKPPGVCSPLASLPPLWWLGRRQYNS